jgi:hypothetical protein
MYPVTYIEDGRGELARIYDVSRSNESWYVTDKLFRLSDSL